MAVAGLFSRRAAAVPPRAGPRFAEGLQSPALTLLLPGEGAAKRRMRGLLMDATIRGLSFGLRPPPPGGEGRDWVRQRIPADALSERLTTRPDVVSRFSGLWSAGAWSRFDRPRKRKQAPALPKSQSAFSIPTSSRRPENLSITPDIDAQTSCSDASAGSLVGV